MGVWEQWRQLSRSGRVIAVAPLVATLGLAALHVGLVLFEDVDAGPAPNSTAGVLAWSAVITAAAGVGLPLLTRLRGDVVWHMGAAERLFLIGMSGFLTMVFETGLISPAGGRRVVLSIAVPLVTVPLTMWLASVTTALLLRRRQARR